MSHAYNSWASCSCHSVLNAVRQCQMILKDTANHGLNISYYPNNTNSWKFSARNNSRPLAIFRPISAFGRPKSILVGQISHTFWMGQQSIAHKISYLQKMADQLLILISGTESSTRIAQNITHEPIAQLPLETYCGTHKNSIKKVKGQSQF